ncbi:hypothetical protein Clacol_005530 [Clathrus columnatus]|uniref:Uncharacterized protein n=1 Tax=Clathrus columnatus TaxID=1419009 RepID=A0AAV5ACU7_9AGAM|nr:hypothetical protein Clacol_005530 [Clathrus columnatus]
MPQTSQPHEPTDSKFQIPDGPPQPHPREEIQGDNQLNNSKDAKPKEHKPVIGPDEEVTNEQAQELGLPEQKHSGKIGLGPEFASMNRVGFGEKMQGVKEQIIGTIKRDHDLVNDKADPFATSEEKKHDSSKDQKDKDQKETRDDTPTTDTPRQDSTKDQKDKDRKETQNNASTTDKPKPDPSSGVTFTNGSHPGDSAKGQSKSAGNVTASDRKQVQEQEQAGKTGDVDLKPGEGRVDPVNSKGHRNKEVERAAEV